MQMDIMTDIIICHIVNDIMKQNIIFKITELHEMRLQAYEIFELNKLARRLNTIWTRQCNDATYSNDKIESGRETCYKKIREIISNKDITVEYQGHSIKVVALADKNELYPVYLPLEN